MTTTRPSRREEQRAHTRDELLDAAARVFAERGYHAASVDLVAEAAGYTKGAVYSNFASKEELFLELLDRRIETAIASTEQLLFERPADERDGLFDGEQPEVEVADREWFLLETEFLLYAARNEQVRERVAERQRRILASVSELMRRHLDELGVEEDRLPAQEYARVLLAVSSGMLRASLAQPELAAMVGEMMTTVGRAMVHQATQAPAS
ncbi:TetR/AcrR family transcriptional regulator [Egicoccus halophilus]|uniref:TetR family transcriptional regulator n=1 Tax=Egicoccus halophilus TaxID=1670830 RepID=A0A8J3EXR4_9ACTN|nr:TetR/AcrR family transcriptional regulator [Egicoccus halophilus]GGI06284.1 TetR family transcriptional regulator [Egicoccus halophilus]